MEVNVTLLRFTASRQSEAVQTRTACLGLDAPSTYLASVDAGDMIDVNALFTVEKPHYTNNPCQRNTSDRSGTRAAVKTGV